MRRARAFVLVLMLGLASWTAHAVSPSEQLPNPADEARARALGHELRCLVCQNQSIDDSDAALARDLRLLVRERIKAGDSDSAIRAFLVARYGEFILLRPSFGTHTLLLWGLPVVALLFGGLGARALFRRRRDSDRASAELSSEEAAALDAILKDKSGRQAK